MKAAAVAAIEQYGVGAGGSRLVTGNHPLYLALEAQLAAMKGTDAACVFGSGYLANIGVLGALAGPDDLVVIDELAHAGLLGARRGAHRHALLVTETVFSMDGDRAPLAELGSLAARHDAWLMTDDAHGLGVGGAHSDTVAALRMGTLSKAVGGYGGYCCASEPVIAFLKTRARSLVYSTALPPAIVAAALAALEIIEAEPDLVAAPMCQARLFTRLMNMPPAESAIVPLVLGAPDAALAVSAALAEAGFLVAAIRPPTVPGGTARLRFAFCARHADADIERLASTLRSLPAVAAAMASGPSTPCPAFS